MKERKPEASKPTQAQRGTRRPRRDKSAQSQLSGPAPAERPWTVPIAVSDIPETGRRIELVADAPTRQAVAKAANVVALHRLEAVFDLMQLAGEGARVSGHVSATVEQNCVVTLELMQSQVEEQVDLAFRLPDSGEYAAADSISAPDAPDPPEMLIGGLIDLGAVATEFLLLGIDPYPRKPEATFEAPVSKDDPGAHPFAALAALKKDLGSKNH